MTGGFSPDSPLVTAVRPSPNHGERRTGARVDAVVLHYTGMRDGASALARLCDPAAEVSSHYVVHEGGAVIQLVPEARRAWHAGRGTWAGHDDLNSASVGIEIVNGGHDFGLPPYPPPQIEAVTALCRDIAGRHGIAPARVLAHSDIAPARKVDPGEHFPWGRLAAAGVGFWVTPSVDPSSDEIPDIAAAQDDLARLGYAVASSGVHDAASRLVAAAFQRRYRPARVDGALDAGTRDTLRRLLAVHLTADRATAPPPAPDPGRP